MHLKYLLKLKIMKNTIMKKIRNPLISGYKVTVDDILDKSKPELISKIENGMYDFTNEKLLEMAVAGWMIYAAQLIIERNARECDKKGIRASFFQEKKKYINRAVEGFEQMRKALSVGFDDWFEKVFHDKAEYCTYVHATANDFVKLGILFLSRTEDCLERRDEVLKAIREMPAVDNETDYEKVLEYYYRKF